MHNDDYTFWERVRGARNPARRVITTLAVGLGAVVTIAAFAATKDEKADAKEPTELASAEPTLPSSCPPDVTSERSVIPPLVLSDDEGTVSQKQELFEQAQSEMETISRSEFAENLRAMHCMIQANGFQLDGGLLSFNRRNEIPRNFDDLTETDGGVRNECVVPVSTKMENIPHYGRVQVPDTIVGRIMCAGVEFSPGS